MAQCRNEANESEKNSEDKLLAALTEDCSKLERLTAGLAADPKFSRNLLAEIANRITKDYLTIEDLAQRLSWEEKTIKNKMETGILKRGVHWFHPKGIRPRFKWSAIVAWLEEREKSAPTNEQPTPADAIPMARGYLLGERRKKNIAALS